MMAEIRPIDVWPPRQASGKPGYSAAHYERLESQDDPLRTAMRCERERLYRVYRDAIAKLDVMDMRKFDVEARDLDTLRQFEEHLVWGKLQGDFDYMLEVLEASTQPSVQRMFKQAKTALQRAKADAGRS